MLTFKVRTLDISKASKSPSVQMIGTSNTLHVSCIGELTEAQTTPLCALEAQILEQNKVQFTFVF
jgi:hypothetical protein